MREVNAPRPQRYEERGGQEREARGGGKAASVLEFKKLNFFFSILG